jgi:hypothetical protein
MLLGRTLASGTNGAGEAGRLVSYKKQGQACRRGVRNVMILRIAQPTCRALQHRRSCVVGSLARRNPVGALSGVEENRLEMGRGSEERAECKTVLAVVRSQQPTAAATGMYVIDVR